VDCGGCVSSPNYPEKYDDSVCTVRVETGGAIKVVQFDTELDNDRLQIGGAAYSGISHEYLPGLSADLQVTAGTEMQWTPDDFVFGQGWKLCPGVAKPTATPLPCPQVVSQTTPPRWKVKAGPCTVDSNGCVQSPGYPSNYMDDMSCDLGVTGDAKIDVVSFSTEEGFDALRIEGQPSSSCQGTPPLGPYSGKFEAVKAKLQGVYVGQKSVVSWQTDAQVSAAGWKLCLH